MKQVASHSRSGARHGFRLVAVLFLAAALALFSGNAGAALLEIQTAEDSLEVPRGFGLRIGFMASDNISRVPEDGEDELIGILELVSNWEYAGARLDAVVAGNLAYRNYTQGEFDNEFRGNLFMGAAYRILPQNLSWQITNHFANAPINPLVPGGPENTQYYNVAETGPRINLRPGARNEFEVYAARAQVRAEVSEIDHERDTLFGRWAYELSERSDFSVNASSQEIRFDDDVDDIDFDKQEVYLGFENRGNNNNFSLALGEARTELDDGTSRDTGVGWIRWSARRTSNSQLFVNLRRRAGDTSAMLGNELLRPASIWRLIAVGDPYTSDHASLTYRRGVRGHEWSAVASTQRLDYMISPFDQEQRGLRLNADMMLASNLLLALSAGQVRIDYDVQERIDELVETSAELDYRLGRNWSIVTGARHVDGDSSDPDFQFKELFLTLFVNYTPGGHEPLGRSL